MKATQLVLNFGKTVMRHLRVLPDHPQPTSPAHPHLRRDPVLEKLCQDLLKQAGCRDLEVTVYWNTRLKTTAGLACWQRKRITLNDKLREDFPEEVQRTLRHELAHLLAQYRAGRRRIPAHGSEWKVACKDLGIPREPRCHNLPLKRVKMERKYFYACRNCGKPLARVRPLKRPSACLVCCRRHNKGQYHEAYRFVVVTPAQREAA